jgi:hypothetical protein
MSVNKRNLRQYRGYRTTSTAKTAAAVSGVVLLGIFLIALSIAITLGAIVAVVFGIIALVNDGVSFWPIFWIILGGLALLGNLFRSRS